MIEHEGTMYAVLKKYGLYEKREDYIDICYIGYAKALNNFDDSKGTLRSYIYKCVENEILLELRRKKAQKRNGEELSIDYEYNNRKYTLNEVIQDDIDLEKELILKETNQKLYDSISKLTKREQLVITNLFELRKEKISQTEIAEIFGVTQAQISRIKNKALIKLRGMMENENNNISE